MSTDSARKGFEEHLHELILAAESKLEINKKKASKEKEELTDDEVWALSFGESLREAKDEHNKEWITEDAFREWKKRKVTAAKIGEHAEEVRKAVYLNLLKNERREATEIITRNFKKNFFVYTTRDDEKSEMWIYDDGIYIPQGKTKIREYCRMILDRAYTTTLTNEVIAKIEADTYIDAEGFFSNNNIEEVAVENGILNITTQQISEFDPKKIFFNKINARFDTKKRCPVIVEHFNNVLKNEEDVPIMQELFGYLLLKDYRFAKAFMFSGSGRNGKSKTLDLIKRFLGVDSISSVSLEHVENDPYALSELVNKLANIAGDINPTALRNTGNFKTLTGGDNISASRKFLTRINFKNYAKLIFACNELPRSYDDSPAFWERWQFFEFPYTLLTEAEEKLRKESDDKFDVKKVKRADPNIVEKLTRTEELSGLLNWALDGLQRLMRNESFSMCKTSAQIREQWIRKSDSFLAFCMDNIREEYDGKIPKSELRKAYSEYCKKHRAKRRADKHIKNALIYDYGSSEERLRSDNLDITYWEGIVFDKGDMDDKGFSYYREKGKNPLVSKTVGTLATLPAFINEKPESLSAEIICDFSETLGPNSDIENPVGASIESPSQPVSECSIGSKNTKGPSTHLSEAKPEEILDMIRLAGGEIDAIHLDERCPDQIARLLEKGDIHENPKGVYRVTG